MKVPKKIAIGITLMMLPFYHVYPQNTEFKAVVGKEKVINDFRTKQSAVTTLSCSFLQTKYISYLSAQIESNGKFFFKSENSIRWEYLKPYQYAIIMNAGKLRIDGNSNDINYKIRENKYIEKVNDIIQDSFCGDIFSNENYNAVLEENLNQFRLTLVPSDDEIKDIISLVYLHFDKHTLSILSIIIHEPSKDFTILSFSDHVYNKRIDNDKFK